MKAFHFFALIALCVLLAGCSCAQDAPAPTPSPSLSAPPSAAPSVQPRAAATWDLPETITIGENGLPLVEVYRTDMSVVETMDFESYLMGVLAGEMHNDWPLEALKAQAIVARTFALRFIADGGSQYPGAQLSTDISEAQAYDVESINDRIRQAVTETRGLIMLSDGEPIQAWFHAHSGGITALAKEGLAYDLPEPSYTRSVEVQESDQAPADVQQWTAVFPLEQVQAALDALGGGDASQLAIAERGESGRVTAFSAGESEVGAVALRMELGSTEMKSTLLTGLTVEDGAVTMTGSGYGHGVGLSQWGAYALASEGASAEEILNAFYRNIEIIQAYGS